MYLHFLLCAPTFFFPFAEFSAEHCFALSFVGILTPSRTPGVCGPAFKPYHLGNTLDAMATCFFFFFHRPPLRSLLSVSNSPIQTQLTNPALVPCASCVTVSATCCTHRGAVSSLTSLQQKATQGGCVVWNHKSKRGGVGTFRKMKGNTAFILSGICVKTPALSFLISSLIVGLKATGSPDST